MNNPIFTIGHSGHDAESFLALLSRWSIRAVADVRSSPYSGRYPTYNKKPLAALLGKNGIAYIFMGRELGGRPGDKNLLTGGRPDFRLVAETLAFKNGIAALVETGKTMKTALLCAEKEPLDCHRTLLVSRALAKKGVPVVHILADGSAEPHEETVKRLFALHRREETDLFLSREELLDIVFALQEKKIAPSARTAGEAEGGGRLWET